MLLRNPEGRRRRVGGRDWPERRLFEQVRVHDARFRPLTAGPGRGARPSCVMPDGARQYARATAATGGALPLVDAAVAVRPGLDAADVGEPGSDRAAGRGTATVARRTVRTAQLRRRWGMRVLDDWLLTPSRTAIHLPTATAVIADLHLGYDRVRRRGGEAVPTLSVAQDLDPLRPMLIGTKCGGWSSRAISSRTADQSRPDGGGPSAGLAAKTWSCSASCRAITTAAWARSPAAAFSGGRDCSARGASSTATARCRGDSRAGPRTPRGCAGGRSRGAVLSGRPRRT